MENLAKNEETKYCGRVISEEVQLRIMSTGEGSGADDWQEGTEER